MSRMPPQVVRTERLALGFRSTTLKIEWLARLPSVFPGGSSAPGSLEGVGKVVESRGRRPKKRALHYPRQLTSPLLRLHHPCRTPTRHFIRLPVQLADLEVTLPPTRHTRHPEPAAPTHGPRNA